MSEMVEGKQYRVDGTIDFDHAYDEAYITDKIVAAFNILSMRVKGKRWEAPTG